jgi:hypothetical protein
MEDLRELEHVRREYRRHSGVTHGKEQRRVVSSVIETEPISSYIVVYCWSSVICAKIGVVVDGWNMSRVDVWCYLSSIYSNGRGAVDGDVQINNGCICTIGEGSQNRLSYRQSRSRIEIHEAKTMSETMKGYHAGWDACLYVERGGVLWKNRM